MREQLTEPAAGGGQRIQPIEPRETDHLGALDRHPTVRQPQNGNRTDPTEGIRRGRLLDRATEAVVQAFEKPVAAVAERQQPIARRGQMSGRGERAHRSFEGRRRDQVQGRRFPEDSATTEQSPSGVRKTRAGPPQSPGGMSSLVA